MDQVNIQISVVTPVYGASECLDVLYSRLVSALERIVDRFEIIMVNDASPDDSWQKIVALAKSDPRLKGVDLSRNFGQHYAIAAGIDCAKGDWVVVMDCDLQHAPEDIERLWRKALEGYDVVLARRLNRKDRLMKRAASRAFAFLYNYLSDVKIDSSLCNFSLISRRVADTLRSLRERNRSYLLLLLWLGFDTACVDVEHAKRFAGKSSYNFAKSLTFAIESISSQSNRPLRLSIKFGFLLSFFSLLYGVFLVLRYFTTGIGVAGWTSVMVSLFFIGGLLFANIGLVGLYLGKVFDETKNRPLYAVKQSVNCVVAESETAALDGGSERVRLQPATPATGATAAVIGREQLKIIDAVWEKRNLGVTCIEVAIEAADTIEDVKSRLPKLAAQYIVIKVPAGRADVMFCLSEMGYAFIEGSLHITREVKNIELSGIQKRLADSVGYTLMDQRDMQILQDEIRKGMFDTDRIYLDPYFTKEQAANRYIGWIQDEVGRGSQVYKMTYKGQSIGFFTMKDLGDGVYYPFLAGMYASHRNSGLGFNIAYKPMCEIAARGGKSISTYISTNHNQAVRIHASVGFSFDQTAYVYVKHNDTRV